MEKDETMTNDDNFLKKASSFDELVAILNESKQNLDTTGITFKYSDNGNYFCTKDNEILKIQKKLASQARKDVQLKRKIVRARKS